MTVAVALGGMKNFVPPVVQKMAGEILAPAVLMRRAIAVRQKRMTVPAVMMIRTLFTCGRERIMRVQMERAMMRMKVLF